MLAPESVVAWIIIGGIAGWLAGVLIKGYGFGIVGNIIIGILGAGIAGILAPRLGLYTEFHWRQHRSRSYRRFDLAVLNRSRQKGLAAESLSDLEHPGTPWLGCSFFTGARNYSGVLSLLLIPQLLNPPSIYPQLWAIPGTLAPPRPGCSYVGRAQSGFLTVNGALAEAGKHSHIGRMLRKIPFIKPMAPTLAKVPPAGPDWLHEVKFDGWRLQLHVENGSATLYSKNVTDGLLQHRPGGKSHGSSEHG